VCSEEDNDVLPRMCSYVKRTGEFLDRISAAETLALIYHGDADGCCSAALLHLTVEARLGKKPDFLHWIGTHDLSFTKTPGYLADTRPKHVIFVDLNIESQPSIIKKIECEVGSRILIYDDHVSQYKPHSSSVVYLNPRQFGAVRPVPPCCIYALRVQRAFSSVDADWLAGVGLVGEGLAGNYPQFMNSLPNHAALSKVARLINAGYLRDEQTGNEVLRMMLNATTDSGLSGILKREGKRVEKLYSIREAVDAEVDRSVTAFDKHARKQSFKGFGFYVYEVLSDYRILHFVASTIYRQRPNVVVLTHQLYDNKRVVEMRSSMESMNLPTLLEKALDNVTYYNFGGHPAAAGASMPPESFPIFLERLVDILRSRA